MTSSSFPPDECRLSHDISIDARMFAYHAIYRAQIEHGDKLPWREEQRIFHKAIHDYESQHPGKIA